VYNQDSAARSPRFWFCLWGVPESGERIWSARCPARCAYPFLPAPLSVLGLARWPPGGPPGVEGTWVPGFISDEWRFLSGGRNAFLDIRGGHSFLP
jgi:hypothetical protein